MRRGENRDKDRKRKGVLRPRWERRSRETRRNTATELQELATHKATANVTSGPSDLQKRAAEDRWNPFMSGKDTLRGKVTIGTESHAATTKHSRGCNNRQGGTNGKRSLGRNV